MATPYELARNYKEWVATDEYDEAATRVLAQIKEQGIEAVYFVSPSIDGRPIGKMVTAELFERVVRRGIRLHPLAFTDFRLTLWGDPIGFLQEDAENTMVPDLTTFRQLPWQPRMARVLCYYYDVDSGDMLCTTLEDCSPSTTTPSARDRRHHVRGHRAGADVARKKEGGVLEHTTDALAFYEIAYLEEFEPIMLDLLDYGPRWDSRSPTPTAEDKSQVEVNQAPNGALAYVDDFWTYRQICRIVARKHGLIATFMAKPFMGCSANGHHHNLSLDERRRREPADRRPQGRLPAEREGRELPRRLGRARRRHDACRRARRPTPTSASGTSASGRRSTSRTGSTTARACSGCPTWAGSRHGRWTRPATRTCRSRRA